MRGGEGDLILSLNAAADEHQWRDYAGINSFLTKIIWPSLAVEHRWDWEERKVSGHTYVFDKIVLVDRSGGTKGPSFAGPKKVVLLAFPESSNSLILRGPETLLSIYSGTSNQSTFLFLICSRH